MIETLKTLSAAIAGLVLIGYLATADFTPPPSILSEHSPTWAPSVRSDCETVNFHQTDAAVEDVWRYAEYMTVHSNPYDRYGSEDVVALPYEKGMEVTFLYHDEHGQQVYSQTLGVALRNCV